MATLFIDYQQLVMQAYERKKLNNGLPHGLVEPAPGKLKEECTKRCTQGLSKRDERVIRDFCGDLNESKSCNVLLERCDTDKFRPLVNYLKGKSENTDRKNIELLAWLIDFSGRPWEMGKEYSGDDDTNRNEGITKVNPATEGAETTPGSQVKVVEIVVAKGDYQSVKAPEIPEIPIMLTGLDGVIDNGSVDVKSDETKLKGRFTKRLAAAVMLSLALGIGGMWWWMDNNQDWVLHGGCMYWHEDHYEPVKCDQKIPNAMVIALDVTKLKKFRKITRPDTITYGAIGKVWYSKIGGEIEYYTSGGAHPVVFNRKLRPITIYIIDKYILSQKNN